MRATAASSSGVPDCRHTQRRWSEISVHWQGWNVVAGEAGGEGDDGGGGGSGGAAPAPRRRRAAEEENSPPAVEQTRNRHFDDDDGSDDGGLNLIPDLDDEEAEDVTRQVAVAPALKTSRVPTIEELDAEIDLALPSASEIGIDLTALQKFLSPKEQVQEEDVPWDYEHEVGKLASETAQRRKAIVREAERNFTRSNMYPEWAGCFGSEPGCARGKPERCCSGRGRCVLLAHAHRDEHARRGPDGDLQELARVVEPLGFSRAFACVAFSPDGAHLLTVGSDDKHTVFLWDWKRHTRGNTPPPLMSMPGIQAAVPAVWGASFNPHRQFLSAPVAAKQTRRATSQKPFASGQAAFGPAPRETRSGPRPSSHSFEFVTFGAKHVKLWRADGDGRWGGRPLRFDGFAPFSAHAAAFLPGGNLLVGKDDGGLALQGAALNTALPVPVHGPVPLNFQWHLNGITPPPPPRWPRG